MNEGGRGEEGSGQTSERASEHPEQRNLDSINRMFDVPEVWLSTRRGSSY